MAKVKFRYNNGWAIKAENKGKAHPIYLRYRTKDFDFTVSLGINIKSKHWDNDSSRVKSLIDAGDYEETNSLLTNLVRHFEGYDIENKRNGFKPSYTDIKKHYHSYYHESDDAQKEMELLEFIDGFIKDAEKKQLVATGTIKSYRGTENILELFSKKKYRLKFQSIDLEFYYDFIEWCESKSLSVNYTGKHIKTIKKFMSEAVELGLTENMSFRSKKFIVLKEEVENIYLTEEELLSMWSLDLAHLPQHEIARDLFLIGSYTGLRISDYNRLEKQNISKVRGIDMIKIITKKTKRAVSIPLHPIVRAILDKNNGELPEKIADQTLNYLIKDVARDAGIDSIIHEKKKMRGNDVLIKKYKFEKVMSHTARRNFCSNAYLSGMNPIDIMSISAHTTEKAFMNYIKLGPDDIAIKMSSHPFFKNGTALKKVN